MIPHSSRGEDSSCPVRDDADTLAELQRAFGGDRGRGAEWDWPERASHVLNYALEPDRAPIVDYVAIRRFLVERWGLPVVETEHAVGAMGPIADADRDYGRCSVRLLDFVSETAVYLVVRRGRNHSLQRMLWALLHELGHFLKHFDMLVSVGTVYQRVCLNPRLETEIGGFARRSAATLHRQTELEADLFAVDWLLPRWIDDDGEVSSRAKLPPGLTADGYRFYRLRCVLDDGPHPPLRPEVFDRLNRSGEEERSRSGGAFPHRGSRWKRASWVLFNRQRVLNRNAEFSGLLREYYKIVGYPPRYLPELRHQRVNDAAFDPDAVWLRRVAPSQIAQEVDAVQWAPLLVPHSTAGYPEYHIPIRPVPARDRRDSTLRWRHMMAPALRAPLTLEQWLERARRQSAGVLLFPRNPAERTLDAEGRLRT
jgi:hypothetical protein